MFKHKITVALAVAIIMAAIGALITAGISINRKQSCDAKTAATFELEALQHNVDPKSWTMGEKKAKIYVNYNATCANQGECDDAWVCHEGRCSACLVQSDCGGFYSPSYTCKEERYDFSSTEHKDIQTCVRKDLFPSITIWDIIATIGCFFGGSLAASAGIGGGGIYVPILMVTRFPPTMAVALSTCCIFGTAISNFIILALRTHPTRKRPLINYSAALIFEPIILSGTTIGVLLNVMLPNVATVVVLILMLVVVTIRTTFKGFKMVRKENEKRKADREAESNEVSLKTVEGVKGVSEVDIKMDEEQDYESSRRMSEEISQYADTKEYHIWSFFERFRFPFWKIALISIAWLVIFSSSLIKGNESILGVKKCSWAWWGLIAGSFAALFTLSLSMGISYNVIHRRKQRIHYPSAPGDIVWNLRNSLLLPALFLSAGLVAGLLGIGGGMVVGPLLLELGVVPEVSMATSAFMILFTSSATMVQFILIGSVPLYYALWFMGFGIMSAILGQLVIGFLVKKSGRSSFIIFIIAVSIGLATVLMTGVGVFTTVQDFMNWTNLSFTTPCA